MMHFLSRMGIHMNGRMLMLLVAVVVAIGGCAGWNSNQDRAIAVMDVQSVDCGIVAPGALLDHGFQLRNDGGRRLVVSRPSCCGAEQQTVVAPGGTGVVRVTAHAAVIPGPFRYSIECFTNDPDHPSLHMTLNAMVDSSLTDQFAQFDHR